MKRIVILGAGYGGMLTAKKLHKYFKNSNDVEITLIDKRPFHTLMTELHEVAAGRTPEDSIRIDLEKIFAGRKVNVVLDEITKIDFSSNKLISSSKEYDYDYLVLGAGSEPAFYGVEGAKEFSFTLWSYEDAVNLKEHIHEMFRKAEKTQDLNERKKMLTFVVAGAGFTGIEMVGELGEYKNELCEIYDVAQSEVSVYVVDMLPTILPILPKDLIQKAENRLHKLGVKILTSVNISKVTQDSVEFANSETINTKTLIWNAGVQGAEFAAKLGLTPGKRGRIQVNDFMQTMDYPHVYAVGDNSYLEEEGSPAGIPQIVETAMQTAAVAAYNIHADVTKKEKKKFKSNYHGYMVSVGGGYAVANLGSNNNLNIKLSGFLAMLTKHLINMHYLLEVAGFNRVWTYMMHEFFHIKRERSFMGGHFSNSSPNFWLVPLRIFLGIMWILEAVKKINDGWLNPENIFIIPSATAGATEAAVTYAEPLLSQPWPIVQWGMDTIIAPFAFQFQAMAVITELVLGAMLIVGLFTAIASIMSAGMTVVFVLTAMAGVEVLWYTFASIALIGGSGSTFGLDYYLYPHLKKIYKKIPIIKKWYLYTD